MPSVPQSGVPKIPNCPVRPSFSLPARFRFPISFSFPVLFRFSFLYLSFVLVAIDSDVGQFQEQSLEPEQFQKQTWIPKKIPEQTLDPTEAPNDYFLCSSADPIAEQEFQYPQGIHNVLEVKKADYDSCTNSSPIATHTSGDDKITIKSPGHRFFICGVPGHCAAGQKVNIRVLKQRTPSSDAPSTAPTASAPAGASQGVSEPGSASTPSGAASTDGSSAATTAPAPNANGAGVYAVSPAVVAVALAVVASMAMLQ